jgi:ureidoacrylate peracid hydrolase
MERKTTMDWTVRTHREPLLSLEEKVDPRHTAVLVIDVLNDFCAEGGMMWHEGLDLSYVQELARRLPAFLDSARAAGVPVIFTRNVYSSEANWYLSDVWLEQAGRRRRGSYTARDVCSPGSWNQEFYGDVQPGEGEAIVTKHRFSAFLHTDLDLLLRTRGIRTLVLTGVATEVCVETTARDGFMRDYYILFTSDGTATYSMEDHERTLDTIDRYFGEVVTLSQVEKVWEKPSAVRRPGAGAGEHVEIERSG